jgi:hypothetical protein
MKLTRVAPTLIIISLAKSIALNQTLAESQRYESAAEHSYENRGSSVLDIEGDYVASVKWQNGHYADRP